MERSTTAPMRVTASGVKYPTSYPYSKSEKERIEHYMTALGIGADDAIEMFWDDMAIEKGEKLFEQTADQKKATKAMTAVGTKTKKTKSSREFKKDAGKVEIMEKIADFLKDLSENCSIVNAGQEISFTLGADEFSLKLTKHRKAKKK